MRLLPALLLALALSACAVLYNVGQTARTTPARTVQPDATFQYASHDRLREPGEDDGPTFMMSNGVRLGLDDDSEVGLPLGVVLWWIVGWRRAAVAGNARR